MMNYAEVAVDAPSGYSRTFTYSLSGSTDIVTGQMVKVPFGSRVVAGIVVNVSDYSGGIETREILGSFYSQPVLKAEHLHLTRWISEHYMCSLFESASLMIPPGTRSRPYLYLYVSDTGIRSSLGNNQQVVFDYILDRGEVARQTLLEELGSKYEPHLKDLLRSNVIIDYWYWSRPSVRPKYVDHIVLSEPGISEVDNCMPNIRKSATKQSLALKYLISQYSPVPFSELAKKFGYSASKALESKGLIKRIAVRLERDPFLGTVVAQDTPPDLTSYQVSALARIHDSLNGDETHIFLLHGVTGSGKTEVYLNALSRTISVGKTAIVMVPEISLTPQTVDRFRARFPGRVAIMHSGLSNGERFDQWWGIKEGRYDVVIGPRSAIFAPINNLGLIVIDEEHEWTYKQSDMSPRYHSRDVAIKLGEISGATLILGSATPDIGSYNNTINGKYELIEIPERAGSGSSILNRSNWSLPNVHVVDMRQELFQGNRSIFSTMLREEIERVLDAGQQTILYLNRRGSGSLIQCRDCGYVLHCRRCDMAMSYHSNIKKLLCHRCNYRSDTPSVCPKCNSVRIRYLGLGTQRVVDEIESQFPNVNVLRWDSDVVSNDKTHKDMMEKVNSGVAQIVVGTQMIAKGLDFPNVALVGVILADIGLFLPDFRSSERVFQLLCQAAGRAGRGSSIGEVVIQTYNPEHYAIEAASKQSYINFFDKEMVYRKEHGMPPVSNLIRFIYSHVNASTCEREAINLADKLKKRSALDGLTGFDIIGPSPAHPSRIRGRYRWHILVRAVNPRVLIDRIDIPQGWIVDIDPISLV
jgi:primosomal protein N' (replication factor Y)